MRRCVSLNTFNTVQCIIGGLSLEKLESGGTDSSFFLKAQECLWNSKEHFVVDLSPPVPGNLHRDKLNKGLSMDGYLTLCSTCLYVGPLVQQKLIDQKYATYYARASNS